jgi:hypothetical protein
MLKNTLFKLEISQSNRIMTNKKLKEFLFKQQFLKNASLNSLNIEKSFFIKKLQNETLPFSQKHNLKKKWWKSSKVLDTSINFRYNYKHKFFIEKLQENSIYFCYFTPNLNSTEKTLLSLRNNNLFSISKILFINKLNSLKFNLFKQLFIGKTCLIKMDNFFSKDFNLLDLKILEKNFFLLGAFFNYKFIRPSEIESLKKNSLKKTMIKFLKQFQINTHKLTNTLIKKI